jgi:molybdenum cofactor guanylyltransferase
MNQINLIKNSLPRDTYGLAVCGGNSSRMGTDKSLLTYYNKPQRYHVYDMLLPFCEKVFISCNKLQMNTIEEGYSFLEDYAACNNIGPMAALLTAFKKFPEKNMLLIGCDYPFLTLTDLQQFSTNCAGEDTPVAFYNEQEGLYEPLLAWYPYQSFAELKKMFDANQYSLQHFLKDNGAIKFYPQNKNCITSIDTNEACIKAKGLIKNRH